jgi:hypothetical protein
MYTKQPVAKIAVENRTLLTTQKAFRFWFGMDDIPISNFIHR